MYDINDNQSAVFAVQSLLRNIGTDIKPDGVYGQQTADAVRSFQISKGIVPTGRVDLETFNALVTEAREPVIYSCALLVPRQLEGGVISYGDKSNLVLMVQAMLKTLEVIFMFEPIEVNGIYDAPTQAALTKVRRINGIDDKNFIDPETWNALVAEYEKYKNEEA